MLGGVVNYFVDPGPPKLPRSTLDNPDTLIPNTKFVYLFPEWLERKTRVWEDNFIFQVQAFLNGPTLLFTRLLKVTHTLWFGFTATLFFYFAGCDRFSQLWASYLSVLLVVVLGIKRFLWRHRPFAVKRARLILTSSSSSFPSRSVLCVIVYSYLFYQMAQMAWEDHLKIHALNIIPSLLLPLVFLAMGGGLTVTTSLVEILVGVHYPTDCIGSAILAVPIIFLGGLVHSASSSHCPVVTISYIQSKRNGDVELPFLEEKMFQRDTLIKWGLFGACLSVLLAQRFALNWKKMYRALGIMTAVFVALSSLSCDVYDSLIIPPFVVSLTLRNCLGMLATALLIVHLSKHSYIRPQQWWAHVFSFFFVYCMSLLAIVVWREWLPERVLPPIPIIPGVTPGAVNSTDTDTITTMTESHPM